MDIMKESKMIRNPLGGKCSDSSEDVQVKINNRISKQELNSNVENNKWKCKENIKLLEIYLPIFNGCYHEW